MKNFKAFIVVALSVLLVGITLFGIFGFNQSVDYTKSYELEVSVDQRAGDATEVLQASVEKYFENKKITPVAGTKQVLDDGMGLIYKFDKNVENQVEGIKDFVATELAAKDITSVEVSAEVRAFAGAAAFDDWMIIVSAAILMALIFVYASIMEKLAGGTATVFSAALSLLLFIALMGITRLPASPFVVISAAIATVIGAALSVSTVGRYKEESKNAANEKLTSVELVNKLFKVEFKKYLLVLLAVVLVGAAFALTFVNYFMVLGAQLVLAALSATFASYFGTPFIWSAVKKNK